MALLRLVAVTGLIVASAQFSLGQIPRTIAYQGVLADSSGNPKLDGSYSMAFHLYDVATGGSALWSESKTIFVRGGLFSTYLGDQVIFGPSVRFDKPYWLGIQVAGGSELTPRTALTSVGYSFTAAHADSAMYLKTPALPGGPAGGDLTGTYPNPTITKMVRTLSFNANSLNFDPTTGGGIITQSTQGLRWKQDFASTAFLYVSKPSDWDTTSDVTLTLYFRTTTATIAEVDFFIRPRAVDVGDNFTDAVSLGSTPVPTAGLFRVYAQSFTIPAARFGTKELWVIGIQNESSGSTYPDDVVVLSVALAYTAVR